MSTPDDYPHMDPLSAPTGPLRPRRPELATFDEVLSGAVDGQSWAFDRLYGDLSRPLSRFLAARGASDPNGLTNDVLVEVFRALPTFRGDESALRGFTFHIARRRLIDSYRRQERQVPTQPLQSTRLAGSVTFQQQLDAHGATGLDEAAAMLEPLTEDQRDVIVLRVICDLSIEETATALNKPVTAIKALQRRALATLRRHHPSSEGLSS